jgi:lactoylglutathione lyase
MAARARLGQAHLQLVSGSFTTRFRPPPRRAPRAPPCYSYSTVLRVSRAFPVLYSTDVERAAQFWELLGFHRHYQLPPEGEPGYVGLRRDGGELAVTSDQWASERYGLALGNGPRFEMYLYVADLDGLVARLRSLGVRVLRDPGDMP